MPTRVLLIDDQSCVTTVCRDMLRSAGFAVRVENDPRQALQAAQEFRPNVAVVDFHMPGMSGAELISTFAASRDCAELPMIVLTGFPDEARDALPPGTAQILAKPLSLRVLLRAIEASLATAVAR